MGVGVDRKGEILDLGVYIGICTVCFESAVFFRSNWNNDFVLAGSSRAVFGCW